MNDPLPGFPRKGFDSPHKITDSIEIIPSPEPDTHIISYGSQDVSTRIIAAIIYSIFAGVFSGVPLYFGIRGWSKLFERPFEEAGMVVAGALLIGIRFSSLFWSRNTLGYFVKKRKVPPNLQAALPDRSYGEKQPLFTRKSGNATVTIFDGGHQLVATAAIAWIQKVHNEKTKKKK